MGQKTWASKFAQAIEGVGPSLRCSMPSPVLGSFITVAHWLYCACPECSPSGISQIVSLAQAVKTGLGHDEHHFPDAGSWRSHSWNVNAWRHICALQASHACCLARLGTHRDCNTLGAMRRIARAVPSSDGNPAPLQLNPRNYRISWSWGMYPRGCELERPDKMRTGINCLHQVSVGLSVHA